MNCGVITVQTCTPFRLRVMRDLLVKITRVVLVLLVRHPAKTTPSGRLEMGQASFNLKSTVASKGSGRYITPVAMGCVMRKGVDKDWQGIPQDLQTSGPDFALACNIGVTYYRFTRVIGSSEALVYITLDRLVDGRSLHNSKRIHGAGNMFTGRRVACGASRLARRGQPTRRRMLSACFASI